MLFFFFVSCSLALPRALSTPWDWPFPCQSHDQLTPLAEHSDLERPRQKKGVCYIFFSSPFSLIPLLLHFQIAETFAPSLSSFVEFFPPPDTEVALDFICPKCGDLSLSEVEYGLAAFLLFA